MTSNQIKYFMSAVRHMNFSEAAEEMFISQPALSRSITAMEDELGFKLFERNNNILTLTEGGDMLYIWFSAQMPHFDAVVKRARMLETKSSDSLVMGTVRNDSIPEMYAQGLAKFVADNPEIDITIRHCENAAEAVKATLDNDIDISIVMESAVFDVKGLVTTPVYTYRRSVVVSLNHPLVNEKAASLKDFKEDNFIVYNAKVSPATRNELFRICNDAGFEPKIIEGDNIQHVMELIEEGKGVGLLYVGHAERYNTLVRFIDIKENITVNQVVSYSRGNKNPNVKKFLNTIFA